jgi:hypothetical protein
VRRAWRQVKVHAMISIILSARARSQAQFRLSIAPNSANFCLDKVK